MANKELHVFAGTYENEAAARDDLASVEQQHARRFIGTYDAAVVVKDADGGVKVHKHEKPTQHAGWTGAAAGAVVGVLFPPAILAGAVVGGAGGALLGHLAHGLSRADIKRLGDLLDEGHAMLVVVAPEMPAERVPLLMPRAIKTTSAEVKGDTAAFEAALADAAAELS